MPSLRFCIVGILLLGLASCSVHERVQRKADELAKEIEAHADWDQLPERTVSWNEAVEFALKHNATLKRAQVSIDDAKRSVRRVYLDFLPGINLDALISKDINNLAAVNGNDVSYNTNILFNIPSITQVPITYYTAVASVYSAEKSLEMKQREVISNIYKTAREYEIAKNQMELRLREDSEFDDDSRQKQIKRDWVEREKQLLTANNTSLGDYQYRWKVDPKTLPKLDWAKYKAASAHIDRLVMTMLAMELESSRLNILGVKMRYFPELNINFYSPSLFSKTGGTYGGVFGSSADMTVSLGLVLQLDTKLSVWDSLQSAKATHKILQEEVRTRALDRKAKVSALLKSREDFESWAGYIRKRAAYLSQAHPLNSEEFWQTRKDVSDMYNDLFSQEQKNVTVEAALIMEYGLL
jgi:hypothetical protein